MHKILKRTFLASLAAGLGLFVGQNARAAERPLAIKLTTLAPKDSSFHKSLLKMAQTWRQVSSGKVELIIYPGGIQGGESAMVQRMNIDQIQAGMLTVVGLSDIEKAVTGLQNLPMMFRNLDEVDYIGEKLQPMLEKRLQAKGYQVLFWADAGWVRFFSKEQALTPDDFRKLRIFTWAGNTEQQDIMKDARFKPVPLETAEIYTALSNGMIDASPTIPYHALYYQIYGPAPHMLELNWAPLVGAGVITKKAWDRIPAAYKAEFLKAAAQAGKEIRDSGRKEGDDAVKTMQGKWGLKVHPVPSDLETEWRMAAEQVYPKIRGTIVPADIFDEVQRLLKEYRTAKGGAK
jgi:TRAP-type C4-dicarboxylate transport system substrate-binding protein